MSTYQIYRQYKKKKHRPTRFALALTGFLVVMGGGALYFQSGGPISANNNPIQSSSQPAKTTLALADEPKITSPIPWPEYGRAAYGVQGNGVLASSQNEDQPVPIASLAKVITALAILEKKPLQPGQQGPMITLTEKDVASYSQYLSQNGSVVPVEVGEQISQYQAMQAMLMSSSNNISDTLVIWAFGSVEEYNTYANKMIRELGLTKTTVADASGFSSKTISTAHDMVQLGILYMQNPVLKEIALQPEANIPVAGVIPNYNSVMNRGSLIGIKVGNTDEAGRCFMLADIRKSGDKETLAVTVVLGAPHLQNAMQDAEKVIAAGNSGYDQIH